MRKVIENRQKSGQENIVILKLSFLFFVWIQKIYIVTLLVGKLLDTVTEEKIIVACM